MKYLSFFCCWFLIANSIVEGQQLFDIKIPTTDYAKKCSDCYNLIKNKPSEIQFGIHRDSDNNLFFSVNNKEWFNKLIRKKNDGLTIDIVRKADYACNSVNKKKKSQIRGNLLPPLYLKELKERIRPSYDENSLLIHLGKLPKKYHNDLVEFNIIFIKNKYLCHYNKFYNLKTYRWDLLEMGMYMDSLTFKSKTKSISTTQQKYLLSHKKLRFEIPFEKNKSDYSTEDIKPLYDSLKLTKYNITNIKIRAYSSIEGSTKRNLELQEERAQNMIDALQQFQKPTISNEITVAENWVEFIDDIAFTNYKYLSNLSKEEIKSQLKNKELAINLEPYLKNHRKAIIVLDLQKKNRFEELSSENLIELFNTSISNQNLQEALEIQNAIFDNIREQKSPSSLTDRLEIPNKTEYGPLLNNNVVFAYLMDNANTIKTLTELEKLEDLLPDDGHIKYNIAAIKFKVWLFGNHAINPTDFKTEIDNLKKYNIPHHLVKRMLINYHILLCEYHMKANDYQNKDKSLRYIYSNYKYIEMSDNDYLSLAQYFSSYAKYDWAIKLLKNEAKKVDANEELIFYYLNLTIINPKNTKRSSHRTIMLNALNINKVRFCNLFDAISEDGITFQLLDDKYLREIHCESCNEVEPLN